jgi:hypothetical protein
MAGKMGKGHQAGAAVLLLRGDRQPGQRFARACATDKANLPGFNLYAVRHRGTTVLRAAKVPKEQIDYQLGHVQGGARTTQDYGQFEPGYLADAARALDAWIRRVLKLAEGRSKKPVSKIGKAKKRPQRKPERPRKAA